MTEFEKFHDRYVREHSVDAENVEFVCEAEEFFHAMYLHIIFAETHGDVEQCVDLFEQAREEFRVADPDAYVRAEVKFAYDFQEYAVAHNLITPDTPHPSIDAVFEKAVTLKAWEVEKRREEAEVAA